MSERKPPDDLHKSVKKPADRHYFSKVQQGSCSKDNNTVIEPRVNVNDDMRAIRDGKATYRNENGAHTYTVNGRTYGVHNDSKHFGRTYPMRGDGFHPLNRGGYQALGVYNKHGNTHQAQKALDGHRNAFLSNDKKAYDKKNKRHDPVMQSKCTRDQQSGRKVWETVKGQQQSQMQQTSRNAAMAGFPTSQSPTHGDSKSKLEKAKEAAKNKSQPSQTSNPSQSQSKLAKAKETTQKNTQAPKPPTQSPKRTR
jgi:hypothetical protein